MKRYRFFLWILFLSLFTPLSFAKSERAIRVELIIFETKGKQETTITTLPTLEEALSLQSNPQANFGQLPEKELALHDAKRRIQKKYHLLLHQGWRQQVGQHTPAVQLEGGTKEYSVQGTFQLRWNQAFYANTDLVFHALDQRFSLKDKSMLRLNEIHYIDHPNAGVLILIRPDTV